MIIKMPGKIGTPSLLDTWTKVLGFFDQRKQKQKMRHLVYVAILVYSLLQLEESLYLHCTRLHSVAS